MCFDTYRAMPNVVGFRICTALRIVSDGRLRLVSVARGSDEAVEYCKFHNANYLCHGAEVLSNVNQRIPGPSRDLSTGVSKRWASSLD